MHTYITLAATVPRQLIKSSTNAEDQQPNNLSIVSSLVREGTLCPPPNSSSNAKAELAGGTAADDEKRSGNRSGSADGDFDELGGIKNSDVFWEDQAVVGPFMASLVATL